VYVAAIIAYGQNTLAKLARMGGHLPISNRVLQCRSAVPFWCGEKGAEVSCLVRFVLRSASKFTEVNSPPLSDLIHLTLPQGAESAKNLSLAATVSLLFLRN